MFLVGSTYAVRSYQGGMYKASEQQEHTTLEQVKRYCGKVSFEESAEDLLYDILSEERHFRKNYRHLPVLTLDATSSRSKIDALADRLTGKDLVALLGQALSTGNLAAVNVLVQKAALLKGPTLKQVLARILAAGQRAPAEGDPIHWLLRRYDGTDKQELLNVIEGALDDLRGFQDESYLELFWTLAEWDWDEAKNYHVSKFLESQEMKEGPFLEVMSYWTLRLTSDHDDIEIEAPQEYDGTWDAAFEWKQANVLLERSQCLVNRVYEGSQEKCGSFIALLTEKLLSKTKLRDFKGAKGIPAVLNLLAQIYAGQESSQRLAILGMAQDPLSLASVLIGLGAKPKECKRLAGGLGNKYLQAVLKAYEWRSTVKQAFACKPIGHGSTAQSIMLPRHLTEAIEALPATERIETLFAVLAVVTGEPPEAHYETGDLAALPDLLAAPSFVTAANKLVGTHCKAKDMQPNILIIDETSNKESTSSGYGRGGVYIPASRKVGDLRARFNQQ